jgi:metallo-beta-lactamase family protein
MKIQFCGAAGEVTGSKHLITFNGKKILLDCGMFQGRRKESDEKNANLLFDPKDLDAVILSHAHMDHSGILPYWRKGATMADLLHPCYSSLKFYVGDSAYIRTEIE